MSDTSSMDMGAVTAVTYLGMSMPLSPRSHEDDSDSQDQVKPDLAPLAEWGVFREEPKQEEKDKEKEKEQKMEEKKNDDDHAKLEELLE